MRADPNIVTFGMWRYGANVRNAARISLTRGVRDLQVEAIGVVAGEAHGRRDDLEELVAVALDADFVEQVDDLGVEFGVAGAVAGEAGGRSHVASA